MASRAQDMKSEAEDATLGSTRTQATAQRRPWKRRAENYELRITNSELGERFNESQPPSADAEFSSLWQLEQTLRQEFGQR